jgi:hypothetical protein
MGITGGFGMVYDLDSRTVRHWVIGSDGIKRWVDTGEACDSEEELAILDDES